MDYQRVYQIIVEGDIIDEVESKAWRDEVVKELEAQGKKPWVREYDIPMF